MPIQKILSFTNNVPDAGTLLENATSNFYGCSNQGNNIVIINKVAGISFNLSYTLDGITTNLTGNSTYTIPIITAYPNLIINTDIYINPIFLNITYTSYCDFSKPCGELFSGDYSINVPKIEYTLTQPTNIYYTSFGCVLYDGSGNPVCGLPSYSFPQWNSKIVCTNNTLTLQYTKILKSNNNFYSSTKIIPADINPEWQIEIGNSGTLTLFKLDQTLQTQGLNINLSNTNPTLLKNAIVNGFTTFNSNSSGYFNSQELNDFIAGCSVELVNSVYRFKYKSFAKRLNNTGNVTGTSAQLTINGSNIVKSISSNTSVVTFTDTADLFTPQNCTQSLNWQLTPIKINQLTPGGANILSGPNTIGSSIFYNSNLTTSTNNGSPFWIVPLTNIIAGNSSISCIIPRQVSFYGSGGINNIYGVKYYIRYKISGIWTQFSEAPSANTNCPVNSTFEVELQVRDFSGINILCTKLQTINIP